VADEGHHARFAPVLGVSRERVDGFLRVFQRRVAQAPYLLVCCGAGSVLVCVCVCVCVVLYMGAMISEMHAQQSPYLLVCYLPVVCLSAPVILYMGAFICALCAQNIYMVIVSHMHTCLESLLT
jgi:hypothetical protein